MEIKAVTGNIAKTRAGAIIIGHFEGLKHAEGETAAVDRAMDGAITRLIRRGEIKGKAGEITSLHSLNRIPAGWVTVVGLGKKKELEANKIRGAAAEALRHLRQKNVGTVAITPLGAGAGGLSAADAARAIAEGAILGLYTFRRHMTKKENGDAEIKEIRIVSRQRQRVQQAITTGRIVAEAANWARDLVNEPANFMTPSDMAAVARKLAEEHGLEIEVLDKERLAELGMGGLLGVAQGSHQPPKFIILTYRGGGEGPPDLALVGKGLTFDSGGISIKPSEGMHEMKGDMAGGAAVMATVFALARLRPKINVTALVPATENMPGGSAIKPGDVVKAMNGKTIEVQNTDAEGRLILADALSYARKLGARAIIDVATLTGACRVALGDICTGAFGNDQPLMDKIIAASKATGEHTWQMPMLEEYSEQIKSDVADIKNVGGRYGGAITAAKFLAEFVGSTPWVHLDIAGTSDTDKEKGYLVKGATGVPVRTLVRFVMDIAETNKTRRRK